MINFEPASVILTKKQSKPEFDFYVTQVEEGYFLVAPTTGITLSEGQILKVGTVTALLTSFKESSGVAKVISGLEEISVLDRGTVERFAYLEEPNYKIISPITSSVGVLSVICSIPSFHKAGRLGWSIYRKGSLLAIGNDYPDRGVIKLNGAGGWLEGSYTLQVSLYEENSLSILRSKSKSIVLTSDTQYIGIGNTHDLEPKLILV